MIKRPALFSIILLVAAVATGCAQNIRSYDLGKAETVPAMSYEAYMFAAGISERSRAVFLRHPDAEIAVEPASPEIISTTATYGEAITFMKMKRGMRSITTEVVTYKGKPLGYLITYGQPGVNFEIIETNLTERGGKIYFSAREHSKADD